MVNLNVVHLTYIHVILQEQANLLSQRTRSRSLVFVCVCVCVFQCESLCNSSDTTKMIKISNMYSHLWKMEKGKPLVP